MKKVKFTPINNQRLIEVFARYRGPGSQEKESVANNLHSPIVEGSFIVKKAPPKIRKMVFSTGRHLFAPARVKEIKIRFVLNK
jgi:hypothetical protein